jgi:glycosyltransferase involved in cell wall biosynthesis
VEFRGEVTYEELPFHLKDADIGLAMFKPLDLTRYAFPLKVVEYMAAGVPVITTNGTEAADLVKKLNIGTSAAYNITAVADAIIKTINDKSTYMRYYQNTIKFRNEFEWDKIMTRAYQIINNSYNNAHMDSNC